MNKVVYMIATVLEDNSVAVKVGISDNYLDRISSNSNVRVLYNRSLTNSAAEYDCEKVVELIRADIPQVVPMWHDSKFIDKLMLFLTDCEYHELYEDEEEAAILYKDELRPDPRDIRDLTI